MLKVNKVNIFGKHQFFHDQAHIYNFPKKQLTFTNLNFFMHLKRFDAGT